MRIELRNEDREKLGVVHIAPDARPTRVSPAGSTRDAFLHWEGAVDDAGRIRRCVACGCADMFAEKAFPQITGVVVVLAFAGGALGALGYGSTPPMLAALTVVLILDVAILVFSRRRLVCYKCRSTYHGLTIARYHRSWDRSVAERYPLKAAQTDKGSDEGSKSPDEAKPKPSSPSVRDHRVSGETGPSVRSEPSTIPLPAKRINAPPSYNGDRSNSPKAVG